jgi:seryl-tRNA synthetase
MYKIPNMIHSSVPIGKNDSENVEIEKIGEPKVPKYEIFQHAELAEKIEGADFETARKTSGKGFYYLRGKLAILHSSLLAFARDYMISQGFEYCVPPFMIRSDVVKGVMSFKEMNAMMYKIEDEDLFLIGTSEHSMIGMFKEITLQKNQLPQKLTSYSPCFRKEVGSHGIEEKGFYRVHQFEKQEMIVICEPEESYDWYEKMLNCTVEVFKALKVPVRKLECCSGDLADLKAKSADVEAWSPRQKKYFEVGSCTNMEEAQARRLGIKINNGKENYFAHTLNNTVIASPRALIALLENNQMADGTIKIPEALWKYTGFKEISVKS